MSAAKEKPVCASHSGEIVQGVHLESPITPTAWPRSVSCWGVPTLQPLKPDVNYTGYLPGGDLASTRRAGPPGWTPPSPVPFRVLGHTCLMDTSTDAKEA